jgi:translation initiation factor IF-2
MAQRERGARPRARCSRRRRRGEGPGRHRAAGSDGSPRQRGGATPRPRIGGVVPPGTSGPVTATPSRRAGGCVSHPAPTHRPRGVCPRALSQGPAARAAGRASAPEPRGEVRRGHRRRRATGRRGSPQGRTRNPPGRAPAPGTATLGRTGRRPGGCPRRSPARGAGTSGGELPCTGSRPSSGGGPGPSRAHRLRALTPGQRHGGRPGWDGLPVEARAPALKAPWPRWQQALGGTGPPDRNQ